MPLPPPAPRQQIHTRQVTCQGFRRDDGLWEIEGHLVDTKTYDFPNKDRGGAIRAGEPIHGMSVRVTLDDSFLIKEIAVVTDHAPFSICGNITPAFDALVGLHLGPGFQRELRARVGGIKGCTHIVELMGPIATTAFQTIAPLLQRKSDDHHRPRIIDTCHALAADGPVVAREWPEFATRPEK